MKRYLKAILIVLSLIMLTSCVSDEKGELAPDFGPRTGVPQVRVALCRKKTAVYIEIDDRYVVKDNKSGEVLHKGADLPQVPIMATDAGIKIGDRRLAASTIDIIPEKDASVLITNKRYRGSFRVIAKDGLITLVNIVNIEHYLASVIGSEMSPNWHIEALRAQAIAARTYALYWAGRRRKSQYDLTADVTSQVYKGLAGETERLRNIIEETAGIVLTHKWKLFSAFYHSTCGGHTSSAAFVFDEQIPPLKGVTCHHCAKSPTYVWELSVSEDELIAALQTHFTPSNRPALFRLKTIHSIAPDVVEECDYSDIAGRLKRLTMQTDVGQIALTVTDFRRALGTSRLRSTSFSIKKKGIMFHITGSGFGHGVGMCQWGAQGMAELGFTAEEILKHYYTDVQLTRLYGTR